jgi:protein AaeX
MLEELHVFGVFLPAALVWAVFAGILAHLLRGLWQRLPSSGTFIHAGLWELALFAALWWGMTVAADSFINYG